MLEFAIKAVNTTTRTRENQHQQLLLIALNQLQADCEIHDVNAVINYRTKKKEENHCVKKFEVLSAYLWHAKK